MNSANPRRARPSQGRANRARPCPGRAESGRGEPGQVTTVLLNFFASVPFAFFRLRTSIFWGNCCFLYIKPPLWEPGLARADPVRGQPGRAEPEPRQVQSSGADHDPSQDEPSRAATSRARPGQDELRQPGRPAGRWMGGTGGTSMRAGGRPGEGNDIFLIVFASVLPAISIYFPLEGFPSMAIILYYTHN